MLSRPVEPQPVKKTLPPFFNDAQHGVLRCSRARPDSANSRYLRTTSPSTSNSRPRAALTSRLAVSLRLAVTGWEDSVVRTPSWNWSLIFRNSSDRWLEVSLMGSVVVWFKSLQWRAACRAREVSQAKSAGNSASAIAARVLCRAPWGKSSLRMSSIW